MKLRMCVLSTSVFVFQCALAAQTSNALQWVGVWQGELDGQPGVTVTLGRDGGELAGTIVFNVVSRDGGEAHVIGHDAHALTHVRLDDHTLAFQVIRLGDGRELHLTMRLSDDEKAQLQCADCGGPSPVDLLRVR
ncbi:MAG TPA: hypothetical protein VFD98_07630 [Terracidiphilus sp.]|jgi:hypothetical protein|nr:hypothetical protein [Terracidiphilus sp.]